MKKTAVKIFFYSIIVLSVLSCVNTRKAVYFHDAQDSRIQSDIESSEPVIQKNDLLNINISSLNPNATEIFNKPNTPGLNESSTGVSSLTNGYLVDVNGFVQLPILGNIKAAGLSKSALRDTIYKKIIAKKLLIDPIVNIRFLNFKISVLGEVAKPSVLTISNEKVTLLEALGLAGDLTIFAKRDNILIIREENGTKVLKRINLHTQEIFTSPYYYLKSNDIVYVEPNKAKVFTSSRTIVWVPVMLSALSVLIIALTRY